MGPNFGGNTPGYGMTKSAMAGWLARLAYRAERYERLRWENAELCGQPLRKGPCRRRKWHGDAVCRHCAARQR